MKPDPNVGTEDEFEEFVPIKTPSDDLWSFKELEVTGTPDERVWTIVDDGGETESWYAEPGYHIVNVIGYLITEKPWTDPGKTYYWYFDDRDRYVVQFSDGDDEILFAEDVADARERADIPEGASIVSITLDTD